jgi:hypothetical protein
MHNTILFAAACYVTLGLAWIGVQIHADRRELRAEIRVKNTWAFRRCAMK